MMLVTQRQDARLATARSSTADDSRRGARWCTAGSSLQRHGASSIGVGDAALAGALAEENGSGTTTAWRPAVQIMRSRARDLSSINMPVGFAARTPLWHEGSP